MGNPDSASPLAPHHEPQDQPDMHMQSNTHLYEPVQIHEAPEKDRRLEFHEAPALQKPVELGSP